MALIGAGINVNLDPDEFPEISDIATSMADELGFEVPREEVLAAFANHFEALWEEAKTGSRNPFEHWKARLITLGARVTATGAEGVIEGVAVDVNDDGTLVIQTRDRARVTVEAGDVTLSPSAG